MHEPGVQLRRATGVHAAQHAGDVGVALPAPGHVDRGPAGRPPRQTRQFRRLVAHVRDLHVGRSGQFQEPRTAAGRTQNARVCRPFARAPAQGYVFVLARSCQSYSPRY